MEINYKLVFFTMAALVTGLSAGFRAGTKVGYEVGAKEGYAKGVGQRLPEKEQISGHI